MVYTGDLVSHEGQAELSRAYVEYAEVSLYELLKRYLGKTPVYAALGNHDTNPEAIDAPHSLPGNLSTQMSWNFVRIFFEHKFWLADHRRNTLPVYGSRMDGSTLRKLHMLVPIMEATASRQMPVFVS